MAIHSQAEKDDPVEQFQQEIKEELEQANRTLKEISLLLEQSQVELSKQTQRNAVITGHLQQVQAQIESLPRSEIKQSYNAALDAQQRLLVMRGQLEKLQSDQTHLNRHINMLEKVLGMVESGAITQKNKGGGSAVLEMVVSAQEAERQRLSRQMHDGPAQALSNFIVQTEIASRFFEMDPARAKEELHNLRNSAMGTFQKVRLFISELRPMMLDDLGLYPTIKRYVDTLREQTGAEVALNLKGQERRFQPYIEVMVFRALQELIGNAIRHNLDLGSKVSINVHVSFEDNLLKVVIADNGKGFDTATLAENPGIGLKLIRERVEMLSGFMQVDSSIGQGCRVSFQVPYQEDRPAAK